MFGLKLTVFIWFGVMYINVFGNIQAFSGCGQKEATKEPNVAMTLGLAAHKLLYKNPWKVMKNKEKKIKIAHFYYC